MNPTPRRPTNITTQLAKERNRKAADRTMAIWIQNCILIIGFGAGFDSIVTALDRAFPNRTSTFNLNLAHAIGLCAIASGIVLSILLATVYRRELRAIESENYLAIPTRISSLGILVGAIVLYGLIAFVALLLVLPWQ